MKVISFLIPVFFVPNVVAVGCDWNQGQSHQLKTIDQPNTDGSELLLPKPSIYIYKRGIGNYDDDIKNAEADLNKFVHKMRLFFHDPKFDPIKFKSVTHVLRDQLATIGISRKGVKSYDDGFTKRYSEVQAIFTAMVDAAGTLQKYGASEIPVHVLLHKVTKLHLSALALFDAQGTLDIEVDGFDERMLHLRRCLFQYVKEFTDLSNVPSQEILVFGFQASIVDAALRKLEVGLPHLSMNPV